LAAPLAPALVVIMGEKLLCFLAKHLVKDRQMTKKAFVTDKAT